MVRREVGILIFPDVEVLDFTGPFEVFSRTRIEAGVASRRSEESAPFHVFTIAAEADTVVATGGLRVIPDHTIDYAPPIDILVIPGGFGTRRLLDDPEMITWIKNVADQTQLVVSVCTGALLLAKAGLLTGRRATTHWGALDSLGEIDGSIHVERELRVVEDGVVTSAGVAAGIDMALSVVAGLHGDAVARETAHYIEFPWKQQETASS
jgi:transcriptional regulator GlxA family with amidase domain